MKYTFDLVIIGGGPGGYVGAIRASQLGLKVGLVEKRNQLGGTCLNIGCIPSKALLDSSEHYHSACHDLKAHGVQVENVSLNLSQMMARKDKVVADLTQGISFLFKINEIEHFVGIGQVLKAGLVQVKSANNEMTELECKHIVLATGSQPLELPFLKFDEKQVLSSTGALNLPTVPKHLVVIGGGVIGLELGSVWKRLGAEVTVVEFTDQIGGPSTDKQIASTLEKSLKKQGMKFKLKSKVVGAVVSGGAGNSDKDPAGSPITLQIETQSSSQNKESLMCDQVLVAIGRKPNTQDLGLDKLGIALDAQGRVAIDEHFQTNIPGIYAIGDLVRGPMLAHKAEEEGVALAEILAGQAGHVNYATCPGVIYTWPEVASVGLTEEQAKEQAKDQPYRVGTFSFAANGRARALGFTDGLCKIIAHSESDKILGVHIIGPRASDLIGEAVVAMEFGASSEDLARSFHAHPTLSEALREAALGVDGRIRQS